MSLFSNFSLLYIFLFLIFSNSFYSFLSFIYAFSVNCPPLYITLHNHIHVAFCSRTKKESVFNAIKLNWSKLEWFWQISIRIRLYYFANNCASFDNKTTFQYHHLFKVFNSLQFLCCGFIYLISLFFSMDWYMINDQFWNNRRPNLKNLSRDSNMVGST